MKVKKLTYWLIGILILLGIGYWFYLKFSRPLPGEVIANLGRDHVTDIFGVKYNSNPPTSGPHFAIWSKAGVYDRLISDGYLIHSLEHGYIIISYDCSKLVASSWNLVASAHAHDEPAKETIDSGQLLMHMNFKPKENESWTTPENQPAIEVELPDSFKTESCKSLVSQLSEFTKVAERVIVAPRSGMDNPIALTAWGRILKLQRVDEAVVKNFIKTFENRGPEATME